MHNNCAETHLGGGDTSAFVVPSAAIARSFSSTLVASTVLRRSHKDSDHTAVITVVHWRLHAKTDRAGKVVSAVITSCLPFWPPLIAIDCAWLPRGMCVNWNQLRYSSCAAASRSRRCNGYQECGCPSLHSWYRENYAPKIKTSWAQWRTWRDSDYTIIILMFDWPKHTIFMLKLTFVVELWP